MVSRAGSKSPVSRTGSTIVTSGLSKGQSFGWSSLSGAQSFGWGSIKVYNPDSGANHLSS